MTDRLDLPTLHREQVEALLREHVPQAEVWAYGSRVNGMNHEAGDLDLVLRGPDLTPIPTLQLTDLTEAFQHSNIPILVEARDWARLPESFHDEIERNYVVVQKGTGPQEWRKVAIGEIVDVVGGGTPSTRNPENFDGDIPWLRPKDLSGTHDRYVKRGERHLSQMGLDHSSAKLVPANSVLLSTRAPIGYVALSANPIATNQGFRNLIPHDSVTPEYLYYWLKLNTETLERHASGTTFRELSGSALKTISISLPPVEEQRCVASVLGSIDDKIELSWQMNETLEKMARALFKSWFVDFDPVRAKVEGRWRPGESLPGLSPDLYDLFPNRLVDSQLGPIPEGWQITTAGDAMTVKGGTTPKTKEPAYWGGEHWFATPKDLSHLQEPILFSTSRQLTDAGVSQIGSGLLPTGTLLLSSRAPIGYLAITETPVTVNQGIIAMICNDTVGPHYTLNWIYVNMAIIKANASGTTFSEISKSSFRSIPFLVPSQPVHQAWESIVTLLYTRIVSNVQLQHTLTCQRDALLPPLLSGKLRVNVTV